MATETGNTYTMGTILEEVVDKNLRIFPIMFKQFKHIAYCFFDVKQLAWENPGLTVAPKEIPGIEPSITVDGYSIKWLDYNTFDVTTTIDSISASALTGGAIDFDVPTWMWASFAVDDTIYIKGDWTHDEIDGTISAISWDTITVKVSTIATAANGYADQAAPASATAAVSLAADQEVIRWFWKRNDNDEVVRPASVYNYKEYQSYIQHFSRRITFTKAELNKEYKYEGEAVAEATKRLNYNIWVMFQEINKAIYKGKNIAPSASDKMEMLWLETISRELGNIHNLASSTDMLSDFYAIIEQAQQSGAVASNDTITLLVNDRFLTELGRFRDQQIRYDKVVDNLEMTIPTLATVYWDIELVRDPMLNVLYSTSVAFTLPKALVKLWTRENQEFAPKGWVTKADQSIRFYDVINNLREQKSYDMVWECWMIAGWMSANQSPYHMIKGFACA